MNANLRDDLPTNMDGMTHIHIKPIDNSTGSSPTINATPAVSTTTQTSANPNSAGSEEFQAKTAPTSRRSSLNSGLSGTLGRKTVALTEKPTAVFEVDYEKSILEDSASNKDRVVHGSLAGGSVALSELPVQATEFEAMPMYGGYRGGSLALSSLLQNSTVEPESQSVPVVAHGTKSGSSALSGTLETTETIAVHGNQAGSLALSNLMNNQLKIESSNAIDQHQQAQGSEPLQSLPSAGTHRSLPTSMDRPKKTETSNNGVGAATSVLVSTDAGINFSDTTPIGQVMTEIARQHEWTPAELESDLNVLKKNRIKTIRDMRTLSEKGWDQLSELLPLTKDLIKQAISWKNPQQLSGENVARPVQW
jgi:hypothetical protein